MHVKSLKVFCDVVARRNFSRAARENGITQSGASQVVNHLEQRLGVKLIDRSRRPFVLTREGEIYYEGCRKIVERYYALEDKVRASERELSGTVTAASIYSVGFSHMNRFIDEFLTAHPKANVRIRYEHPKRIYELVETDQVEVGLVSYPRASRSIDATPWRDEPIVVVCRPGHELATRKSIDIDELSGRPMVGFDRGLPIRRQLDKAMSQRSVEVRMAAEFDNIETVKRAIEANTGVGLLPAPTVRREVESGTLVAVPLAGNHIRRPLGVICRRGRELGCVARRFIELLHEQAEPRSTGPSNNSRKAASV